MIPSNKPVYARYKLKIINHDGENKEKIGINVVYQYFKGKNISYINFL